MEFPIDDYINYKDGIITTPEAEFDEYKGIGHALYNSMLQKTNIAQIDAESGEKDFYPSFLTRCVRTALEMKTRKVTNENIICICSHNNLNSGVPFVAAQFLGIRVASIDPTLSVLGATQLIAQVVPKLCFVSQECLPLMEESLGKANIGSEIVVLDPTDGETEFSKFVSEKKDEGIFRPREIEDLERTAVIVFSSGTTGLPKGVCLPHLTFLRKGDLSGPSNLLTYIGLHAITSITLLISSIMSGSAKIIAKSFVPEKTWEYIEKYKINGLFLAPVSAMEFARVEHNARPNSKSLKLLGTGGSCVSINELQEIKNRLPGTIVVQSYGLTEAGGLITAFNFKSAKDRKLMAERPQSCGRPMRGISYKVVDVETEKVVSFNERGELRVKAKHAMSGYHNLDSSTAFDESRWLKTGDVVYYDEDFCFYVVDRIKDIFDYKSLHVTPAFIEHVALTHPSIKECVVFGIPDGEDGNHPAALMVLVDEAGEVTPEDVRKYVDERTNDRHKLRGSVKFVKRLLYTTTGKVKRAVLRDLTMKGQLQMLN